MIALIFGANPQIKLNVSFQTSGVKGFAVFTVIKTLRFARKPLLGVQHRTNIAGNAKMTTNVMTYMVNPVYVLKQTT